MLRDRVGAVHLLRASRATASRGVAERRAVRVVIVVTHHLEWPNDALDRVLVLDRGRVRYNDPLTDGVSLAEQYDAAVRLPRAI